jgi:hypothetical protein
MVPFFEIKRQIPDELTMSPLATSLVVFLCVFGGALLGIFVSPLLPVQHQSSDSKDIVRLGMGLVATMVAVALGLLIASAKSFYDTQCTDVTQLAANYIMIDRVLSHYGPETSDARAAERAVLAKHLGLSGPLDSTNQGYRDIESGTLKGEVILDRIQDLSPKDDNQRSLKTQAVNLSIQLAQTRWLMFEQNTVPLPNLLFFMLICWLSVLFTSFGIFAPRNFTVLTGLFVAAVAVCGAILLILSMFHPQSGLIQVSDAPLRAAFAQLGQ